MELLVRNNLFAELSVDELFTIDGGDPARQRMTQQIRNSGSFKVSEADKKTAIGATAQLIGIAGLAAGFVCVPLGVALSGASILLGYGSL